ncbi:MAG: 1-acyl-sn-glycerol-3-phosphate acyltransferase [Pseudomonadales bacterium]|nr:1-acyl-sn-glycerol-3-phosphate acyltransferase [Pseudomonadales bacterium]
MGNALGSAFGGALRLAWRLPAVVVALLVLLLSVTATARWPGVQRRCLRWGAQRLCQAFSVTLPKPLALPPEPCLLVSNHISWLDVVVFAAVLPPEDGTCFLAKQEVGGWPVIGPFARRLGIAFIDRTSKFRSYRALPALGDVLGERPLFFFPEGTTTAGHDFAPLRPMGLALSSRTGASVQPFYLAYLDARGSRTTAPAFVGDDTLLESVLRLARAPAVQVHLETLQALPAGDRKAQARALGAAFRSAAARVREREAASLGGAAEAQLGASAEVASRHRWA